MTKSHMNKRHKKAVFNITCVTLKTTIPCVSFVWVLVVNSDAP